VQLLLERRGQRHADLELAGETRVEQVVHTPADARQARQRLALQQRHRAQRREQREQGHAVAGRHERTGPFADAGEARVLAERSFLLDAVHAAAELDAEHDRLVRHDVLLERRYLVDLHRHQSEHVGRERTHDRHHDGPERFIDGAHALFIVDGQGALLHAPPTWATRRRTRRMADPLAT